MVNASKMVVVEPAYSAACSVTGSLGKPQYFVTQKACYVELNSLIASKILVLPCFLLG